MFAFICFFVWHVPMVEITMNKKFALKILLTLILQPFGPLMGEAAGLPVVWEGRVKVPFVMPMEEKVYLALLDELPQTIVSVDEEKLRENVVRRISRQGPGAENAPAAEELADVFLRDVILPHLLPRVEKFNELMNQQPLDDTVTVGFLAFTGLGKAMADAASNVTTEMLVVGRFRHVGGLSDEGGEWTWVEPYTSGVSSFSRSLNGAIDESLELDLRAHGYRRNLTLRFQIRGEVRIEQTHEFVYLGRESPEGVKRTTIRARPRAALDAKKEISEISGDTVFQVDGGTRHQARKVFPHPAVHELEVAASAP